MNRIETLVTMTQALINFRRGESRPGLGIISRTVAEIAPILRVPGYDDTTEQNAAILELCSQYGLRPEHYDAEAARKADPCSPDFHEIYLQANRE